MESLFLNDATADAQTPLGTLDEELEMDESRKLVVRPQLDHTERLEFGVWLSSSSSASGGTGANLRTYRIRWVEVAVDDTVLVLPLPLLALLLLLAISTYVGFASPQCDCELRMPCGVRAGAGRGVCHPHRWGTMFSTFVGLFACFAL